MAKIIGIYGASGFGREVISTVLPLLASDDTCIFVDDGTTGSVMGIEVVNFEAFTKLAGEKLISLAVADATIREKLATRCADAGIEIYSVFASSYIGGLALRIGNGAIFSHFTHVTADAKIGQHFHCNIYSYVAHECQIGDFVTFAPAVKCNGNVTIGDRAYIGTGAIIRQGLTIGSGATIGMGAVVTKDVPAGETWVGNPARPINAKPG